MGQEEGISSHCHPLKITPQCALAALWRALGEQILVGSAQARGMMLHQPCTADAEIRIGANRCLQFQRMSQQLSLREWSSISGSPLTCTSLRTI